MPAPIKLTDQQIKYMRTHWRTKSAKQIARDLGLDQGVVYRNMQLLGIKLSRAEACKLRGQARVGRTSYTVEEDQYILDHYLTTPIKAMATQMGRSYTGIMDRLRNMGLTIPDDVRERNRQTGRFYPGMHAPNAGKPMPRQTWERCKKTMFKSGSLPHNTLHDGAITVRHDRRGVPYKFIRIGLGKWEALQRYTYRQHHGSIPHGMIVLFKDGDSLNCDISNLELITKQENMQRNTIHNLPQEIKETINALSQLKNKIRNAEKQD